jgi:hypothetical protein
MAKKEEDDFAPRIWMDPKHLSMMDAAWAACNADIDNQLVMVVTLTAPNPDKPPQPTDGRAAMYAYEWRHPRAEIKFTPGAAVAKITPYQNQRCTHTPKHWVHSRGEEELVDLCGASPTDYVRGNWSTKDHLVQRVELRNEELFDAESPYEHSVLVYDTMDD